KESLCNGDSAVNIENPDQRLISIRKQRSLPPAAGLFFPAVQEDVVAQVEFFGNFHKPGFAYKVSLDLRQLSFREIREAFQKPCAYNEPKNRIAKEFQCFIVLAVFSHALVGKRPVSESAIQQRARSKRI